MFDTPLHILAQIIGFIAILFVLVSYQQKHRRGILIFLTVGCVLFSVHFSLLGAFSGAAMNILLAFQAFLFSKYESKNRPRWPLFLMLSLFLSAIVLTWSGLPSLLPGSAAIITAFGNWQRSPQNIRWFGLSIRPLWFSYNLLCGSVAGMISELLNTGSLLVGLWRYRKQSFQKTP